DDPIDVAKDPVARAHDAVADADQLAVTDALQAPLRVQRREAGGEHRKVHRGDAGRVARQPVDHGADGPAGAGRRGQQLAPESAAAVAVGGGDEHVARAQGIDALISTAYGCSGSAVVATALRVRARPESFHSGRSGRSAGGSAAVRWPSASRMSARMALVR